MPRFLRTCIPLRPCAACLCGSRGHVCLYVTGGCHQEALAVTPQRVTTDSHAGRETGTLGRAVPVSPRRCDKVPRTRCLGAEEATPLTARGQKPRARVSESEPDAGWAPAAPVQLPEASALLPPSLPALHPSQRFCDPGPLPPSRSDPCPSGRDEGSTDRKVDHL